jgi:hypothetical protein
MLFGSLRKGHIVVAVHGPTRHPKLNTRMCRAGLKALNTWKEKLREDGFEVFAAVEKLEIENQFFKLKRWV